jgi:hypothetical protein
MRKYPNNGFNPKVDKGKELKHPSNRQTLRDRKRLTETLRLIRHEKIEK